MVRRAAAALALAGLICVCAAQPASAHVGLLSADPAPGATLGATPTLIRLSFSERPDVALSSASVVDARGVAYQTAPPQPVAGDPLSFQVPLHPLSRGVYTVRWRVDSAVDGHATTGTYEFGVLVAPSAGAVSRSSTTTPVSSPLELVARWLLLSGLVALLGAASAAALRFGGEDGTDLLLAAAGLALAVIGLLLLGAAQRGSAHSTLAALLRSPVGHALIWRGVALAVAGVALLVALIVPAARRGGLIIAGCAGLAAVVVHVAGGHAAASRWPSALTVVVQSAHVAVAGVWIGGLAALVLGLRGAPSPQKTAAITRFSIVAAGALAVVVATGVARAISELRSWGDLFSTGYGRAVLAKLVLVGLIAAIATRSRTRGVTAAGGDLGPLRRSSRAELALAALAIALAALLGTLAPPVSGRTAGLAGLSASGTDVGGRVRVQLHAASDEPGRNRFVARIADVRNGTPVQGASVQLLFTPLDDPGVASTTLGLSPAPDGTYVGSGANLAFDGRWGVRTLIANVGGSVEVPLELDPVGPPQQLSVEHIAGQAPTYTTLVDSDNLIRISPHPERAGQSRLLVTFYTGAFDEQQRIRQIVVTLRAGRGAITPQRVRRLGPGTFASPVTLTTGQNQIAVIGRTDRGVRLRSVFDLDVPAR